MHHLAIFLEVAVVLAEEVLAEVVSGVVVLVEEVLAVEALAGLDVTNQNLKFSKYRKGFEIIQSLFLLLPKISE